jgi:hypothetical protein
MFGDTQAVLNSLNGWFPYDESLRDFFSRVHEFNISYCTVCTCTKSFYEETSW